MLPTEQHSDSRHGALCTQRRGQLARGEVATADFGQGVRGASVDDGDGFGAGAKAVAVAVAENGEDGVVVEGTGVGGGCG